MIARRRMLASFVTAATAALIGLGATQAPAQDMLELTVALGVDDANFNPTTASVFKLAESMGFYEKYGLKVTFVALDGTPQAVAALQADQVDLADISLDAAIRLKASNGVDLKGVVAVGTGSPFLIAAKDDIKTLEDLQGRSYAIADNGSLDHQLTQAVLRGKGLDPASPAYVPIGAPLVRVQALAAGQVDATTVSFGTYSSIDGTPGIHVLFPADEFSAFAPALSKFTAAKAETIAAKGPAIQAFTNALIDVSRDMEANPAKWVEAAAAARNDLPKERLEKIVGFLASRWCVNGCLDPAEVDASVAYVYENPDFADVPKVAGADMVDFSFTQKAMETLGTAGGTGMDAR